MFAAVLSFLIIKNTGFYEILELSRGCNDKMCKFNFWRLQFQGFFPTQNLFGYNSRNKLVDLFFVVFNYIGSLSCCRDYFCGSLSGCKHVLERHIGN